MKQSVLFSFIVHAIFGATSLFGFEEKPLVVVIPSYNNAKYYERNLDSVFSQKYSNYRVIYVNDASTDGTGDLVEEFVRERGLSEKITIVHNEKNQLSATNLYYAINSCKPEEIVIDLDGDDWLAHDGVFAYINNIYQEHDVWVTYGNMKLFPSGQTWPAREFTKHDIEHRTFRKNTKVDLWHLRTFYAGLYQQIRKEDLQYNGAFFQVMGDNAFMLPILEMAGDRHRCIKDVLYIYNRENPINVSKIKKHLIRKMNQVIRSRQPYPRLEHLPWL